MMTAIVPVVVGEDITQLTTTMVDDDCGGYAAWLCGKSRTCRARIDAFRGYAAPWGRSRRGCRLAEP
jgi:hypothetical protein